MPIATRRQFVAGTLAAALARPTLAAPLTADAVRGDLAIFADAYRQLHPGLDRYLGADRFSAMVEAERTRLSAGPADTAALYLALARLTAAVRCGHSYPNPVNQSDAVLHSLLDGRDRVPFAFRWLGGRAVVTRVLLPGLPLKLGDAIEALDGVPMDRLLARLLPLARADGHNDAKRRALMQVDGRGRYNAFDVYRPLVSPARGDGTVEARVDGRTLHLPAMTDAERQALAGETDDGGWRFVIADGAGRLTMPTWALYNSPFDWRGFIVSAIEALNAADARGLVVDLRDNEGGQDCGDVLLAHLTDRPVALPAFERRVRYRQVPEGLRPYLDTWDRSFFDWGDAARVSDQPGFYRLERDADDRPGAMLPPASPRFAGPVAVLISPTCSSATFQFAQMIQASGRAVLVGEPTGGNRRGINGGAYFFLSLPGSGLEVDLPLIGYFPLSPQPDAGIEPDVTVAPTRAQIAAGHDPALARALALVT